MLNTVRKLKTSRMTLEVDFFLTPMQVQEKKDERPYFGYLLFVVDRNSGMILGLETLSADPSFSDMLAKLPQAFLTILAKNTMRPHQILVQSERTYTYLMPVCEQLEIKVNPVHYLPSLEEAKSAMLNFLER